MSVPVAFAAKLLRIPVVTHESDLTPGLATKLIAPLAKTVICAFAATERHLSGYPTVVAGIPIRAQLHLGSAVRGAELCGFELDCPTLLVMGGSLGAVRINEALAAIAPQLVERYQIVHITGKSKAIDFSHQRYRAFEYCGDELAHILAMADVVVSRAGANSIFEFLALHKPMLLIPLQIGSRGDQLHNARYFAEEGFAEQMSEIDLVSSELAQRIDHLFANRAAMVARQQASPLSHQVAEKIFRELLKAVD